MSSFISLYRLRYRLGPGYIRCLGSRPHLACRLAPQYRKSRAAPAASPRRPRTPPGGKDHWREKRTLAKGGGPESSPSPPLSELRARAPGPVPGCPRQGPRLGAVPPCLPRHRGVSVLVQSRYRRYHLLPPPLRARIIRGSFAPERMSVLLRHDPDATQMAFTFRCDLLLGRSTLKEGGVCWYS